MMEGLPLVSFDIEWSFEGTIGLTNSIPQLNFK